MSLLMVRWSTALCRSSTGGTASPRTIIEETSMVHYEGAISTAQDLF